MSKDLRQTLRNARKAIPKNLQEKAAQAIATTIAQQNTFKASHSIAVYHAQDGEVDPSELIKLAWAMSKTLYLPKIQYAEPPTLIFQHYTENQSLHPNAHGILEPQAHIQAIPAAELDLVLVPLVAFDHKGARLGRGAGYYDRAFSFKLTQAKKTKPYLLGLAYELQKVDEILTHKHDVFLDGVVTEQHFYDFCDEEEANEST